MCGTAVCCAKRLNPDHENKIRKILCSGPSAKMYTLKIYPLYGIEQSTQISVKCGIVAHYSITLLSGQIHATHNNLSLVS